MFTYAEPVTFYEAGAVSDPYSGEDEQDWDNPVPVLSAAAGVEPLASQEPLQDGRQAVIVGYRLYFDHLVTIDRLWRVDVRGERWKVEGRAASWRNPFTGWEAGTVVQVGGTDA